MEDDYPNRTAYFHAKFDHVEKLYNDGQLSEADDVCCQLIASLDCPRLVLVHAWQIRSGCTNDFFKAKSFLQEVYPLLNSLPTDYDLDPDGDIAQVIEAERKQTVSFHSSPVFVLVKLVSDLKSHSGLHSRDACSDLSLLRVTVAALVSLTGTSY